MKTIDKVGYFYSKRLEDGCTYIEFADTKSFYKINWNDKKVFAHYDNIWSEIIQPDWNYVERCLRQGRYNALSQKELFLKFL